MLETIEMGIFQVDNDYLIRCRKQVKFSYEGKEIPMWEKDKTTLGVAERGRITEHIVMESG